MTMSRLVDVGHQPDRFVALRLPGSFEASSVKILPFEASTRTFDVVSAKNEASRLSSPLNCEVGEVLHMALQRGSSPFPIRPP